MTHEEESTRPSRTILLEATQCREIVQEVLNFGVNQRQLLVLIRLLAVELENNAMMKRIVEITNEALDEPEAFDTKKIII